MNKTGKTWVAAAWVLAAALTGCDGHHDMPDTSMKAAHILCAGGETMSYEDCVAQGKEAVAVVFYLNHDENVAGTGYAVYLHDLAPCGGDPLPDDTDDCWYWTSTEVSGQETAKAWLFSMGSGAMQETPKLQAHKVRPIVTLYNEE